MRVGEVAVVGGDQREPRASASAIRPGSIARSPPARGGAVRRRCGRGRPRANAGKQPLGLAPAGPRPAAGRAGRACRRSAGSARRHAAAMRSNGSCGRQRRVGVEEAGRTRRWRLARPAAFCASRTSGSGARRGLSARVSASWQPMIGCTPFADAGLAELQRAEQVGGVGDRHRRHAALARQGRELVRLDRAFAQRIGGVDAQMDEACHANSAAAP